MNRIDALFTHKRGQVLSVFYTAGYPDLHSTVHIAALLEEAGVDMIELGIPFSDPIADGPVIQGSNMRAIANGMTVNVLLRQVKELRTYVRLPVVLMGYLNPVLQYGVERFLHDAASAGADGVILPDLPLQEYNRLYRSIARLAGLHTIFLVSPSSSDNRIRELDAVTSGFLYAVSRSGVTGSQHHFTDEQRNFLSRLQRLDLNHPVLAGFGISTAKAVQEVNRYVQGTIIGSAFIEMLGQPGIGDQDILNFVRKLKGEQCLKN